MSLIETYSLFSEKLKRNYGIDWLKTLKEEQVQVESEMIENTQSTKYIDAFKPTEGWIQSLDKTSILTIGFSLPQDEIISAELINNNGQSLHLRPVGTKLIKTLYTPHEGERLISAQYPQIVDQFGKGGDQQAIYQVYWAPDDTVQPKYSRLIAIEKQNR